MGHPTTFVSRDNEHFEVYDNVSVDRGAHRIKFGVYWFHLKFRPRNPQAARGSFGYTGQWTGSALADFMLGYPMWVNVGIGSGSEDTRTNWLHGYIQDNSPSPNSRDRHRTAVTRADPVDDRSVGGTVRSRDEGISSAQVLLPSFTIPWVTE